MSVRGTSEKCCCFSICLFVSLQTSTLLPSWRRWKTPWVRLSNAPSLPSCNALLPIGYPQHFYYCQKQPQQNQPLIHRIVSFYLTSLGATYFSLNFAKKDCKRSSSFQPEPAHFSSADDTDQQWPEQKKCNNNYVTHVQRWSNSAYFRPKTPKWSQFQYTNIKNKTDSNTNADKESTMATMSMTKKVQGIASLLWMRGGRVCSSWVNVDHQYYSTTLPF